MLITICGLDLSYSMLKVFPSKHCEEKGTWLNCLFEKKSEHALSQRTILSSPLLSIKASIKVRVRWKAGLMDREV